MATGLLNPPPGYDWITRLTGWHVEADALFVTAATASGGSVEIELRVESPEIWHMRMAPDARAFPPLPMIVGSAGPAVRLEVEETAAGLTVRGVAFTLDADPRTEAFKWSVGNRDEPADRPALGTRAREASSPTMEPVHPEDPKHTGSGAALTLDADPRTGAFRRSVGNRDEPADRPARPSCPPVLPARPARGTRARVAHGPGWHTGQGGTRAREASSPTTEPVLPENPKHTGSGTALTLEVGRDPWCLTFRDIHGRVICRENPFDVDGLNRLFIRPLGFGRGPDGAITQITESFHLRADEHIYGLGEKFTPLDKTGQRIVSWTVDALGAASERAYKNVPLLISSRGYGLFLNTGRRITYELGTESCETYTVIVDGPYLDAYLIYGPAPAQVLERYTCLTGRAPLPPKWSFGLWLSGSGVYRDEKALRALVEGLAKHDIPCDVIHVDPWWMRWRHYADFEWDRAAFPHPEEFLDWLHGQGLRLSAWQHPYVSAESELFAEGQRLGHFVRRPDGQVYVIDYGLSLSTLPSGVTQVASQDSSWNARVAIIDLTSPGAVEWYKSLMRPVLKMGLDVFKTDFGEDIPADAVFANGMTGAEMHNLYPLLYNRAVFEVTQEAKGAGLVWSRSGYAGSQRYPTCWSGDPACSWDSLAFTIRGGLSLGLSGVPFWSNDIGGYRGHPSEKLYTRWAQFGLLCSHARCHGESQREPWFFGDRATEIFRRYARLRYQLFPYLYACAYEAVQTGLPVLRAMPLAFPEDINGCDKDLQYMVGPWLLVAPITDESDQRNVYLPAGRWTDFWTGQRFDGPMALSIHAPLDTLPVFVRGGAVLPGMAPALRIPNGLIDPLIVDVYADGASTYRLIEDEGVTDYSCVREEHGLTFTWTGGPQRALTARFHGISKPSRVAVSTGEAGPTRVAQWDVAADGVVEVRVPACRDGWLRLDDA